MKNLTGSNIVNISLLKQSDVFTKTIQTISGVVNVPESLSEGDALKIGTLLKSDDAGATWNTLLAPAYAAGSFDTDEEVYFQGHIFKCDTDANTNSPDGANWTDLGAWNPNGILANHITATQKTTVVITGSAKGKHLVNLDDYLKVQLFTNKLLVR